MTDAEVDAWGQAVEPLHELLMAAAAIAVCGRWWCREVMRPVLWLGGRAVELHFRLWVRGVHLRL